MMKYKLGLASILALMLTVVAPGIASAHVVVSPHDALTGSYETFTASVPNEKDIPVTGIRLVIPKDVTSVTPTVKAGWQIQTKKSGDNVTEISWTEGQIDAELRDEFTFSAHMPDTAGDIVWKAYQTYQDGSVVAWDQKPAEDHAHESKDESKGPYSTTIVNPDDGAAAAKNDSSDTALYVLSIAALALAATALVRTSKSN
jgi:uncharacterized protein YcnI